eukprot:9058282-Pyramimonas_sp.AAC.1
MFGFRGVESVLRWYACTSFSACDSNSIWALSDDITVLLAVSEAHCGLRRLYQDVFRIWSDSLDE